MPHIYREAGNPENPTVLLLHGFPSSSHMFRELMPELAGDFHLIAPDLPAFGQTVSPSREEFTYSFDHLARIVDKFTEAIGLTRFAMYVFDYGAPIGYRCARHRKMYGRRIREAWSHGLRNRQTEG